MSAEVVEHVKLAEERDGVGENERELGLQCREPVREDEQSKVIDDQNGCPGEDQDELIGQLIKEEGVIDLTEQKLQHGKQCQESGSPITTSFGSSGEGKCEETEEHQVEVTEQQLQHGEQSRELILEKEDSFVIEYQQNGSPEPQYEGQDEANGEKNHNQMQVTEVIGAEQTCKAEIEVTEQHREDRLQSQEPIQADHQLGLGDEQQNEVIGQKMQEIALVIEEQDIVEEKYRVTEGQVEVSEQWLQFCQEFVQEEQHSLLIDYKDGSLEKHIEQQDIVNEQKSQKQMQVTAVIVENYNVAEQTCKVENGLPNQEEQNIKVIDNVNVCPDEQQGEVIGHQVQNQMQEIALIVEKQNVVVQKYEVTEQQIEDGHQSQEPIQEVQKNKVSKAQVQVTEQQPEYGQQSREPIQEEQHDKMAEAESGSPNEKQGDVNGHHIQIQCQEFIATNQNVAVQKYKVTEEQVEVIEQQTECGQQNQEPIQEQNSKVIDYQNGLSKPENEQKDEVNGQKNKSQIQVITEIVDNHNVAELFHEVTKEQEVEVTEQQRDHGQQSQEEQNSKVIDCQDGYPMQQNEQLDGVNGNQVQNQMQDIVVSVEKQIDAKLKYKVPEDQMEEPCHSTEQQCEVTKEHIEGIKRQIQFQEEVVEGIDKLTTAEALQVENVSELQEQIELLRTILNAGSMQASFCKKPEKAAAIAVNSTPLTRQKLPYQSSSTFSRENCLELLRMTHKLQEKTHRVQESLLDLLTTRELSHTTPNSFVDLEERTMPIADSCGEREYMDCGFPAQMKHHQLRQLRPWGKKASESDCRVSKEPNCQQEQQHRDPVQEKSKCDGQVVELSCQTQQQSRELAQQRELPPQGQRRSKSESLLTTSVVDLSPRRNQDPQQLNTGVTEKPQKLKTSAKKTGQTQQQQRQLRSRGKILSECKQVTTRSMAGSSPSQPLYEQYQLISSTARSQVEKPGIENSSQSKKQPANHSNRRKRGTPEPTTMPNAIGPILPCKKLALGCQNVELPTPEACEDVGPTIMDKSSQPVVQSTDHHGQQKMLKSKPTTMAESPQLNSASVEDLPQTAKELQQKQLCHMNLRSCSQAASQSELVVSMAQSLPSEHHYEQPQEMKHQGLRRPKLTSHNQHNGELKLPKHPEQPQKPRGRPSKRKLDVAATEDVSLPAKYQKLQEEPQNQRQERPPKLERNMVLGLFAASKYEPAPPMTEPPFLKLNPDNEHHVELQPLKHPEQPQKRRGRPRKLNPDNELVKNCRTQSTLSSHKREDELQLPKQPEQPQNPKRRRGRPCNISVNELKQEMSQRERRQSKRLKEQKEATM
ncbi:uncharacterized protein LOC112179900 isoform X1 [Rosa chinensis]|uniref:uncharacterized protein LOC112179900 isoform X1 n=1 Tax=Rosa chinensis TaxID=74649 RepID=UPI001AD8A14B|nr:uncharacterized protein LOC112179900 isoform X1 [Rosa chinensis]